MEILPHEWFAFCPYLSDHSVVHRTMRAVHRWHLAGCMQKEWRPFIQRVGYASSPARCALKKGVCAMAERESSYPVFCLLVPNRWCQNESSERTVIRLRTMQCATVQLSVHIRSPNCIAGISFKTGSLRRKNSTHACTSQRPPAAMSHRLCKRTLVSWYPIYLSNNIYVTE